MFSYVGALHYRFSKGLSYAKHTAEGFPRRRFFYSQLPAKPYTMSFTCTTTSNCTFTATFSRLQLESEDGGCSNAPVYAPASLATTNITVAIRYPTSGSSPSPLHPASPTRIAVFELAVNGPLRYVNGSCLVSRQRRRYPYAATSRLQVSRVYCRRVVFEPLGHQTSREERLEVERTVTPAAQHVCAAEVRFEEAGGDRQWVALQSPIEWWRASRWAAQRIPEWREPSSGSFAGAHVFESFRWRKQRSSRQRKFPWAR